MRIDGIEVAVTPEDAERIRAKRREALRRATTKARAAGKCIACRKRKAVPNRSICQTCKGTMRAQRRALHSARRAAGQCVTCGQPRPLKVVT